MDATRSLSFRFYILRIVGSLRQRLLGRERARRLYCAVGNFIIWVCIGASIYRLKLRLETSNFQKVSLLLSFLQCAVVCLRYFVSLLISVVVSRSSFNFAGTHRHFVQGGVAEPSKVAPGEIPIPSRVSIALSRDPERVLLRSVAGAAHGSESRRADYEFEAAPQVSSSSYSGSGETVRAANAGLNSRCSRFGFWSLIVTGRDTAPFYSFYVVVRTVSDIFSS